MTRQQLVALTLGATALAACGWLVWYDLARIAIATGAAERALRRRRATGVVGIAVGAVLVAGSDVGGWSRSVTDLGLLAVSLGGLIAVTVTIHRGREQRRGAPDR